MPVKGPHNRKSIAKASWVATAVRLSDEGHSIRSIAQRVGKSSTTVWKALEAEFERVRPKGEELRMLRDRQRGQIDRQLQAWIPRSIKGAGNHHAALVVARFLERAAKLDGLDAPIRNEHTGVDGAPIMLDTSGMSVDDLTKLLATLEPVAEGDAARTVEGGPGEEDRGGEAGT